MRRGQMAQLHCKVPPGRRDLRQEANLQVFEFDRRAFGFKAEITSRRSRVFAAGNLLAVDPQADFPVDPADIVVIPFARALAQFLARKAAAAVGRFRLKWRESGGARVKYVAVCGEKKVLTFAGFLHVVFPEGMVK